MTTRTKMRILHHADRQIEEAPREGVVVAHLGGEEGLVEAIEWFLTLTEDRSRLLFLEVLPPFEVLCQIPTLSRRLQ
jgi:hypothetical protein